MPTKFDFVSPGIELREIDQSTVTPVPEDDGILLIGRASRGPAMKPIKIDSISNFHQTFGTPMNGTKQSDPWRQGNTAAGGWAGFAAEAYLAAGIGPVKFIRLAGLEKDSNTLAGWNISESPNTSAASNQGAMGIFVAEADSANITHSIAASLQNEVPASQGGPTAAGLGFNAEMLSQVNGGSDLVQGTTDHITLEIQYLDLTDPTASITIEFFDSASNNTSTGNANIDVDLNTAANAADINDAVKAALDTFFADPANTALVGNSFTHAQSPAGDPITITLDIDGGSGNTRTITATGALGGASTPTAQNIISYDANNDGNFDDVSSRTFSGGGSNSTGNGTLAAIIYTDGAGITLTGNLGFDPSSPGAIAGAETFIRPNSSGDWTIEISDGSSTDTLAFNFNPQSARNIRNVLNTDPTLIGGAGSNNLKYFLGESFEYNVQDMLDSSKDKVAWIAHIDPGTGSFSDHNQQLTAAKSGWFIGTEASQQKKLFRFEAIEEGGEFHKNYVIRIKDLKEATSINPDATFTVELAEVGSSTSNRVERYTGCNLNINSDGYIAKKIGNLKLEWSVSKSKQLTSGTYNNISDYIRVEVASGVTGTDLPVGFVGPANPVDFEFIADTQGITELEWMKGKGTIQSFSPAADHLITGAFGFNYVAQIKWPTHELSTQGTYINQNNYPATALHGLSRDAQRGSQYFGDIGFAKKAFNPHLDENGSLDDAAYVFSLEYLKNDGTGKYYYDPTLAGTSNIVLISDQITAGVKQFVAPFFGGTDGVDITIENPFNDTRLADSTGYEKYTLDAALSQVSDSDIIRYDMIAIPGVTNRSVNQDLIRLVEERGDALAIIDLGGIYQTEEDHGTAGQEGTIADVVTEVESGFNSSYAATYYPNVRIADPNSSNVLMAPPSVAAIGAIAKSESVSQPWFAPAGFNRGALAPLGGIGGASVVGTLEHLNKADRDALYDVNINPIARFPATGDTVIFGQKTLQQSASALDRINVRRMMIHLKKKVGAVADTILFEQSVKATFDKFKSQVDPILLSLQNTFGVSEYKIVLDETTTTPDLQDRNIMYAKVFVKPAKAIEFIAVDFVITQSGAEF